MKLFFETLMTALFVGGFYLCMYVPFGVYQCLAIVVVVVILRMLDFIMIREIW